MNIVNELVVNKLNVENCVSDIYGKRTVVFKTYFNNISHKGSLKIVVELYLLAVEYILK